MKLIKNDVDEYIQKFMLGEEVYEMQTSDTSNMSSNKAMKYSAVFACNRVLGETLSALPFMEYRRNADGTREITRETAAYDILHNEPNPEMSPFNFKEACMTSLNLGGNIVCQKRYWTNGGLAALTPIMHQNVKITRVKGNLVYTVSVDGNRIDLSRDQVFHIPGMSFDGVIGLSPISYMAGAINLGMSYEKYGNNFYKNGALTSGTIEHPLGMSDVAFQRLKEEFAKNYQGLLNSGKPIILEEGAKYNPISITPMDAQLLESKRFQIEDICRIYRVPLHLVQDLSRSTNNNIEHQSLEFVMYTMLPYFKRWEENVNMQLLTPLERKQGYYLEINAAGLLRGDMKTRADSYAIGRQWGWLSVNDIRKLENMPPIPNGDIYLTPLNMYEAGTTPPKAQSQEKTQAIAEEIYKMLQDGGKLI
jgi:HK97 family phage portal protein